MTFSPEPLLQDATGKGVKIGNFDRLGRADVDGGREGRVDWKTHRLRNREFLRKRLKVYYGLQVSTNPQTIRLFVNDPKLVTPAYLAFLEKNIRARFGLEGAPLRIFLKARTRKD